MLLPRPPYQLDSLLPKHRWEVTRRHPWYQLLWQIAAREFDGEQTEQVTGSDIPFTNALGALGLLGVSGKPPHPATDFASLCDPAISPMWLAGGVHPFIIRTLIAHLILSLPRESLAHVATLLRIAYQSPTEEDDTRAMALVALNRMNDPNFDKFPVAPFVRLNPAASERELVQSLKPLLREWKAKLKLPETRNRPEIVDKYLGVWDLREGWDKGKYSPTELTIQAIARRLRLAPTTVDNYCRRAFELIVGHPYSRETWMVTCGLLRFSRHFDQPAGKVGRARPRVSRRPREVPTTRLSGDRQLVERVATAGDAVDMARVVKRIQHMFEKGLDDDMILGELDYNESARPAIESLRSGYESRT